MRSGAKSTVIPNPSPVPDNGYWVKSPPKRDAKEGSTTESDAGVGDGEGSGDGIPRRADSVLQTGCLGDLCGEALPACRALARRVMQGVVFDEWPKPPSSGLGLSQADKGSGLA